MTVPTKRVPLLTVPALFKRKSADEAETAPTAAEPTASTEVTASEAANRRAVRDKNAPTPKRQAVKKKRPPKNPPLTHKEAREQAKSQQGPKPDKDARRAAAAERREERQRIAEGQDRGDPAFDQYHMPRDKGPERLLVRDIVDARRNVGQYFFLIAIIIMLGSGVESPLVQQVSLIAWVLVLIAFVVDSILLCRKVMRIVKQRYPKHAQRKAGLCWYAISRSIMFRKLRMPRPRPGIEPGIKETELGKVFRR
jgi:hypothetical protein